MLPQRSRRAFSGMLALIALCSFPLGASGIDAALTPLVPSNFYSVRRGVAFHPSFVVRPPPSPHCAQSIAFFSPPRRTNPSSAVHVVALERRCRGLHQLPVCRPAQVLSREEVMLVYWHAPWCPHCKDLTVEMNVAAEELEEMGIAVS